MHALCGAHCRTTGKPCKNPPMPNGRCRMHGGKSPGRPMTHGHFSSGALKDRAQLLRLNREVRALLKDLKS